MKKMIFSVLGTVFAVSANAGPLEKRISAIEARVDALEKRLADAPPTPASCKDADLRRAQIGFRCKTSKGAVFERVDGGELGESWKAPNGYVFGDAMSEDTVFYDAAVKKCENAKASLPEAAVFLNAQRRYGLSEVIPSLSYSDMYWSSTKDPEYSGKNGDWHYAFYIIDPHAASLSSSEKYPLSFPSNYKYARVRCVRMEQK